MKLVSLYNSFLIKAVWFLNKLSSKIYNVSPQSKRTLQWVRDNGDKTYRLDYDLDCNSIVFDLGGYEGQWASDIFAKYQCQLYIFEPVVQYAEKIEARFHKNNKIQVYRFGLSNDNLITNISVEDDSSSLFKKSSKGTEAKLVRALDFISENKIRSIDLVKINIEGGEYDLLEHLITNDLIANIHNIQVQFHDFVPDAQKRRDKIQVALAKTHFLTYQYPFVWENWKLKEC